VGDIAASVWGRKFFDSGTAAKEFCMKTKRFFAAIRLCRIAGLMVVLLALGLVASASLTLAGCDNGSTSDSGGGGGSGNKFVGTWKTTTAGATYTITFYSDLTCIYSAGNQHGTYTYSGNNAAVTLSTNPNFPVQATLISDTSMNLMGVLFNRLV
jgi:hypothetical protein